MFELIFLNCFQKISNFGDSFFNKAFGFLFDLPGVVKGLAAIAILSLIVIGVLTLLKKSLKIFGIIISVFIIIILVSLLLNK